MKKRFKKDRRKINSISKKGKVKSVFRIFLLIVTLFLTVTVFFILSEVNLNKKIDKMVDSSNPNQNNAQQNPVSQSENWAAYENKNLGFSMKVPMDLILNESGPHGDYYDFIRFEEGTNSLSKGVMVGVKQGTPNSEIKSIKEAFQKSEALLVEEKSVMFNGLPSTRLYYKHAQENSDLEERVIIIVQKGIFTYSISTVPEQMPRLIDEFKFIPVRLEPTGTTP